MNRPIGQQGPIGEPGPDVPLDDGRPGDRPVGEQGVANPAQTVPWPDGRPVNKAYWRTQRTAPLDPMAVPEQAPWRPAPDGPNPRQGVPVNRPTR